MVEAERLVVVLVRAESERLGHIAAIGYGRPGGDVHIREEEERSDVASTHVSKCKQV